MRHAQKPGKIQTKCFVITEMKCFASPKTLTQIVFLKEISPFHPNYSRKIFPSLEKCSGPGKTVYCPVVTIISDMESGEMRRSMFMWIMGRV